MNTRKIGALYEDRAVAYLEENRYEVVARNYRNKTGEIDIIAWDHSPGRPVLTFTEVKYRRRKRSGYPEESVTQKKQQIIRRVAEYYMLQNRIRSNVPCRFDVIVFDDQEMRHITNAF